MGFPFYFLYCFLIGYIYEKYHVGFQLISKMNKENRDAYPLDLYVLKSKYLNSKFSSAVKSGMTLNQL